MKISLGKLALGIVFTFLLPLSGYSQSPVYFVINNQTGFHNDSIYIAIQGSSALDAWSGGDVALNLNTSYSLTQLQGNLPSGTLSNVPIIYSTTMSGGFFNITVGQPVDGNPAPNNIISGRFEANVQTGPGNPPSASSFYNTNVDISYVNSISMPMSFAILDRTTNQPVPLTNQLSVVNTNPAIWNSINNSAALPSTAFVTAAPNYQVKAANGQMGTVTGNVTLLASGSVGAGYHDWLTNSGPHISLLNTLQSANAVLNVSSFTVPNGDTMQNVSWTFSTVNPVNGTSPFGTNDPTNRFLQGQDYTTTATFTTDLNPGSDPNLTAQGITQGTAGVIISGFGGTDGSGAGNTVGDFQVYITNTSLNSPDGIYGSNPTYTVVWTNPDNSTTYYATQQNSNNFLDRVVGDLTAAITFGWAGSDLEIATHAANTNTEAMLNDSIFSSSYSGSGTGVSSDQINQISTSQYFYLLSLLGVNGIPDGTSGENIAAWSGSQINPTNPLFYDNYGDVLVAFTDAYSYPYSDRLQLYSPDIFPMPATGDPSDADGFYIYITLLPGGYDFSVNPIPEPSGLALLGFGLAALAYRRIRRK
jgi:hypothetical protein